MAKLLAPIDIYWQKAPQESGATNRPVVVLIHNFGGTHRQFSKHIDLITELGFDVATFDLSWHKLGRKKLINKKLRKFWADEILIALKLISAERPIIPFTFSGLGVCTLDASVKILQNDKNKIKAMIFDSGPFVENEKCIENMLKHHFKVPGKHLRTGASLLLHRAWDSQNTKTTEKRLHELLNINPELPVLSIQGKKDLIVPYLFIQECFNPLRKNDSCFQEVLFENGGHLTSLKMDPVKYHMVLSNFLKP